MQKHLTNRLVKAKYGYALDSDGKVGNIIVAAPTQAHIKATISVKPLMLVWLLKKAYLRLPLL